MLPGRSLAIMFALIFIFAQFAKGGMNKVQLNKYETAPHFTQLNQNLTSDCWLI